MRLGPGSVQRSRARLVRLGALLGPLLALGCGSPEPTSSPPVEREPPTQGAEPTHPALAYETSDPAPAPARFQPVAPGEAAALLAASTRAGAWSALRRGGEERRSAGNFLCRLETLFGRAPILEASRVAFVLRDTETGLVLTAFATPGGPAFGAVVDAADPDPSRQTQAASAVIDLATLLDVTRPRDCTYLLDGTEVGVRQGAWR